METSLKIATQASALITKLRSEIEDLDGVTSTKSSAVDPVTAVDTAAENFIAEQLSQLRPNDGLLGEEGTAKHAGSGVTWIVDPIDGTVNFLYGIPHYAVSIAAAVDGEVVAGTVSNVATGEQFHAARGAGAWVRTHGLKQQIRVTSKSELRTALLATGFSYDAARRQQQASLLVKLLPQVRDIRRCGSAALDLCALACGRIDGYYEHALNPWDFAAGALIAAEAGARVWAPELKVRGQDGQVLVAAAPQVADEMYAMLQQVGVMESLPG